MAVPHDGRDRHRCGTRRTRKWSRQQNEYTLALAIETAGTPVTVAGHWRRVRGRWRWIKPYARNVGGLRVTLTRIDAAPTCDPPGPGELDPETLAEFSDMLEAHPVWLIDFPHAILNGGR